MEGNGKDWLGEEEVRAWKGKEKEEVCGEGERSLGYADGKDGEYGGKKGEKSKSDANPGVTSVANKDADKESVADKDADKESVADKDADKESVVDKDADKESVAESDEEPERDLNSPPEPFRPFSANSWITDMMNFSPSTDVDPFEKPDVSTLGFNIDGNPRIRKHTTFKILWKLPSGTYSGALVNVNNPLFQTARVYKKEEYLTSSLMDIRASSRPGVHSTSENSKFRGSSYTISEKFENLDIDLSSKPTLLGTISDIGPGLVDLIQFTSKTKKIHNSYVSVHLTLSKIEDKVQAQIKVWKFNPNEKSFTQISDLTPITSIQPEWLPSKSLLGHTLFLRKVRADVIASGWEKLISKSNLGKNPILNSKEGDSDLGKAVGDLVEEKEFWVSKVRNEKSRIQAEMIKAAGKSSEREQIRRKDLADVRLFNAEEARNKVAAEKEILEARKEAMDLEKMKNQNAAKKARADGETAKDATIKAEEELELAEMEQNLTLMQTDNTFSEEDKKEKAAKIEEQAAKEQAEELQRQINAKNADIAARAAALALKARKQADAEKKYQAEQERIAKKE
jgi:hypothetical protein